MELVNISVFSFLPLLSFASRKKHRSYILNSISNVYIGTRVISTILILYLQSLYFLQKHVHSIHKAQFIAKRNSQNDNCSHFFIGRMCYETISSWQTSKYR